MHVHMHSADRLVRGRVEHRTRSVREGGRRLFLPLRHTHKPRWGSSQSLSRVVDQDVYALEGGCQLRAEELDLVDAHVCMHACMYSSDHSRRGTTSSRTCTCTST